MPPQEVLACRQYHALPVSEPYREQVLTSAPNPAKRPKQDLCTLPGGKTHTQLPWLERMGWGREAEVGATLGGEPLGRMQEAAESRESSLI